MQLTYDVFKLIWATGLGFRRRGAPERRDGTKAYGVACHVFPSVIRVAYSQPFTHSLCWVLTGISFSLPGSHALIGWKSGNRRTGGNLV